MPLRQQKLLSPIAQMIVTIYCYYYVPDIELRALCLLFHLILRKTTIFEVVIIIPIIQVRKLTQNFEIICSLSEVVTGWNSNPVCSVSSASTFNHWAIMMLCKKYTTFGVGTHPIHFASQKSLGGFQEKKM